MNADAIRQHLETLNRFTVHWSAQLKALLQPQEAGRAVGISFEPAYQAAELPQAGPVNLGFYTAKGNPAVGVEVIGCEAAGGLVILDSSQELDTTLCTETMSWALFERLFEPQTLPPVGR